MKRAQLVVEQAAPLRAHDDFIALRVAADRNGIGDKRILAARRVIQEANNVVADSGLLGAANGNIWQFQRESHFW